MWLMDDTVQWGHEWHLDSGKLNVLWLMHEGGVWWPIASSTPSLMNFHSFIPSFDSYWHCGSVAVATERQVKQQFLLRLERKDGKKAKSKRKKFQWEIDLSINLRLPNKLSFVTVSSWWFVWLNKHSNWELVWFSSIISFWVGCVSLNGQWCFSSLSRYQRSLSSEVI